MKTLAALILTSAFATSALAASETNLIGARLQCTITTVNNVQRSNGQSYDNETSTSKEVVLEGNQNHAFGSFKVSFAKSNPVEFAVSVDQEDKLVISLTAQLGGHALTVDGADVAGMQIDHSGIRCALAK